MRRAQDRARSATIELFLKFWKQHFMYFGHKHVEIGGNCLYEIATFLMYQMPLIFKKKVLVSVKQELFF